jgi:hypothetical protein
VLVEPVDHLDQRSNGLELATPDRLADEAQGRHQAFELQMRVVRASVDDPLAQNFRDDLANPLGADALLAGDLVIGPVFAQLGENPLPPGGLAENVEPPTVFLVCSMARLITAGCRRIGSGRADRTSTSPSRELQL